ncbi:FAD-dependent oxidoreductase [Mesorhizobium sp. M0047]|uniref:GcvT family protein n=1 Tax=Mesorhizobium sp. M0047 TaxID=2956859 RepID=UPI00333BA71A
MHDELPDAAHVVIIGGGIIGCSIAYHLTKAGVKDVVVLERKQLTSGTTWHAAGIVGQLRPTRSWTELAKYGVELYKSLEAETGQATGFKQNGSLRLAQQPGRFEELKRSCTFALSLGIEAHMRTPREISQEFPNLRTDDLVGGLWIPSDGQTNPTDTTMALAKGARLNGAKFFEGTKVTGISVDKARVRGVEVDGRSISADIVINCTGMWAHETGKWTGTPVPLHAVEHFYIVTEQIPGLPNNFPVIRDNDDAVYYKEDAGKLLIGATEREAKPWAMDGIPNDFCFDELAPDYDHFLPSIESAFKRIPSLADVGIKTFFNGPESFTPDQRMQLGPVPGYGNYYIAAGMNTVGIQAAAGIGQVMTEWVTEGVPSLDVSDSDVRRNLPFFGNKHYLFDRTIESVGAHADIHWPYKHLWSARGARRTPLHDRLASSFAFFGQTNGWERALWFGSSKNDLDVRYSFGPQSWFNRSMDEHLAVRNSVGFLDYSWFSKFVVVGRDAEKELNRICASDVSVRVGKVLYTVLLNSSGGIEADLTVVRTGEQSYLLLCSCANQARDYNWIKTQLSSEADVTLLDETSALAGFAIMGPGAREAMKHLTGSDLTNESFPHGTSRLIDFGYTQARAVRISFAGELGWETYFPVEFAAHSFDRLRELSGSEMPKLVGLHALDSLRIEKGFRHYGHDISPIDTPLEAGLDFLVSYGKKGGFVGREELIKRKDRGVERKLVQFLLPPDAPFAYHDEPIYRNGALCGHVTSGAYGHTLGGWVCLGYVSGGPLDKSSIESGQFEIEVGMQKYAATASLTPMYDSRSLRMRS